MIIANRRRWVVRRKSDGAIMCKAGKYFSFKCVDDIGMTAVKTYRTENMALAAYELSYNGEYDVEAVEVLEKIVEVVKK